MKKLMKGVCVAFTAAVALTLAAPMTGQVSTPVSTVSQAAAKAKLSKKKITIKTGDKYKLKVKNAQGKVTWSSSKKSVASVSKKGVVKGKKKGTAVITAKVKGKKLKCKVVVKKAKTTLTKTVTSNDIDVTIRTSGVTSLSYQINNHSSKKLSSKSPSYSVKVTTTCGSITLNDLAIDTPSNKISMGGIYDMMTQKHSYDRVKEVTFHNLCLEDEVHPDQYFDLTVKFN